MANGDDQYYDPDVDQSGDQSGSQQDPNQGGDTYDPTADPSNYDENGNYVGEGAYDEQGNWVDPFGQGWQGPGDPSQGAQEGGGPRGGGGLGSSIWQFLQRFGPRMADAGTAIGAAGQAAGQNRLNQEQLALEAAGLNLQGRGQFENALMGRAQMENQLRQQALGNIGLESRVLNPRVSPFDPTGGPRYSDQYKSALHNVSQQGGDQLSQGSIYADPRRWQPMQPYQDIPLKDVQGATGTKPGFWSNVGGAVGPVLGIGGALGGGRMPVRALPPEEGYDQGYQLQ